MGGPAAYAARHRSVRPVLVEPEVAACRAARALFDLPAIRAVGSRLPFADESFDAAWSLGVLCTMERQLELLTELRRVVRPTRPHRAARLRRRIARRGLSGGNNFPTQATLAGLLKRAGLAVSSWQGTSSPAAHPEEWQRRVDEVSAKLRQRYGGTRAWKLAERQGELMDRLLTDSLVTGELLALQRTEAS